MLIYSPSDGGFDSAERSYSGYSPAADRREYQLRPAKPVRCALQQGDLISITCSEGATSAWLIPFNDEAQSTQQSLGLQSPASATNDNTVELLQPVENVVASDLHCIYRWLDANGAGSGQQEKTGLRGYRVFDAQSRAGDLFTLRASETLDLWFVIEHSNETLATGGAGGCMQVQVKPAVTSLRQQDRLPEPLDDYGSLRDEFTVSRSTALAYEVKAGEYVQIIDVEGQQCSDFMAMRKASLDDGQERFIDSTVTRSMVGEHTRGPVYSTNFLIRI